MNSFQKWAAGKNPFLVVVCHQYVKLSEWIYAILLAAQDDVEYGKSMMQPDLGIWLSLYKDHRRILNALVSFSNVAGNPYNADENVFRNPMQLEGKTADEIYADIFNVSDGEEFLQNHIALFSEATTEKTDDNFNANFDAYFQRPDVYFLMRVYLPCWLLYGLLPGELLRKARLKDVNSLEQLLRLDSSAIFDPKIAEYFHQIRTQKKSVFDRLAKALSSTPSGKITVAKMKVFIAGYISVISESFGEQLTEPQIRGLFDAIAQDEGKGDIDTDLPESAESFYMAIYRERPFWEAAM